MRINGVGSREGGGHVEGREDGIGREREGASTGGPRFYPGAFLRRYDLCKLPPSARKTTVDHGASS